MMNSLSHNLSAQTNLTSHKLKAPSVKVNLTYLDTYSQASVHTYIHYLQWYAIYKITCIFSILNSVVAPKKSVV